MAATRHPRGRDVDRGRTGDAAVTRYTPWVRAWMIGAPPQLFSSRACAERVVTRLLEVLRDLEQYRGIGRLYLP